MPTGIARRRTTASEKSSTCSVTELRQLYFGTGRWRHDFLDGRATGSGRECEYGVVAGTCPWPVRVVASEVGLKARRRTNPLGHQLPLAMGGFRVSHLTGLARLGARKWAPTVGAPQGDSSALRALRLSEVTTSRAPCASHRLAAAPGAKWCAGAGMGLLTLTLQLARRPSHRLHVSRQRQQRPGDDFALPDD